MKKRLLSMLMAVCLLAGLLPTAALAEGGTPDPTPISVTVNNCTKGTASVDAPAQWYEGANRFSVTSKLPCVVIVEHSDGKAERLYCGEIDAATGHYRFFINAADGDKISIAVKGDVNLDGIVTNVVHESRYDADKNYWEAYTLYTLNADGTRTSVRENTDIWSDDYKDVAKLSAYISAPESNALSTIQLYAADINDDGKIIQTDVDSLKNYISGSDTSVSWDINYNCYTITFDTGEGGSTVPEQKVLAGEAATAPAVPTKEGCFFDGWYKGDALYDIDTPVTEDITLTAKWSDSLIRLTQTTIKNYKVFDGVGGINYSLPSGHYYLDENISVDDIVIYIGTSSTPASVVLDLNGYELKNVGNRATVLCPEYTSTLTLTDNSSTKTGKVSSSSGRTVYLNPYGILNANGGTVEGVVSIGGAAVIDNTDPSNVTVFTGEVTNGGTIKGGIFTGTVSRGTIEDSAKVTVSFDSDNGNAVQEEKVLRGQKVTAPAAPTKAGYSFRGWYMGDTAFDFAKTPVTENITLTAKWSVIPVIPAYPPVIEEADNGSVSVSPKNPTRGDTVTITPKAEAGYTLETITVTDRSGEPVEVTNNGDGTYSFTQPAGKVTVTVTFMEDNSMLNFFVDVFPGDYYYDAVLWAAVNEITGGVDDIHFAPNAPCTRGQAVTFLWRAAGCPAPKSGAMPFTDVKEGTYYYDAVLWAVENGITDGVDDTHFAPNDTCSRSQIVTFLWRAQNTPEAGTDNPFTDVAEGAYYTDAVLWAAANGITDGTGDGSTFSPDEDCVRGQIVAFLWRAQAE